MDKVNTTTETRWVTSADGVRMTYQEWREMIEAERN